MTRFSQWLHDISGTLGQEPVGRPGIVVLIPDDFLPRDPVPRGIAAHGELPAAAGFRSEILIGAFTTSDPNRGVEIRDMWVRSSTASAEFEIIKPAAAVAGFTDQPNVSGDLGMDKTLLRIFTKNSAAATGSGGLLFRGRTHPTAGAWVQLPNGVITLRGRTLQTSIIVRPSADNQSIGVMFSYRELEKRSL